MESPVRICIGAALVAFLLLLCSTPTEAFALNETISTTPKDDKPKTTNNTLRVRPDISLNELNPKETISEEHTEKNAKYKDRGKVRYDTLPKYSTTTPRRVRSSTSTETPTIFIVTPTPEVKRPAQIIDSMRSYKKTKMPLISTTTPVSVRHNSHEEFEDKEDEESKESYEKYTSSRFHDSFFTIPSFSDEFKFDRSNDKHNNRLKDYGKSSYSFSTYFPDDSSDFKEDKDPYKSSFFDFDTELTTPKNDFFDKKYKKISSSIINNLESIRSKSPPPNVTSIGVEKLSNNTPSNKSTVFIKNTKEIRMSDNEGAGSASKQLSDVQGTSVYYEMSVLSTETYTINHSNDDDCENDTESVEPTASTSSEKELSSIKATQPPPLSTEANIPDKSPGVLATSTSEFFIPRVTPTFNSFPHSTQSTLSSTEKYKIKFPRNRSYSKRLNSIGLKDSLNNITPQTAIDSSSTVRSATRKFFTTPKIKPVWMSVRRNITRASKPATPSTIYAEHFDIKHKFSTTKPRVPTRTVLTTVSSSEIDPVLVSDVSGIKKIVHTQTVRDNAIPSLRKRGSMKFGTSTASSAELDSDINEFELPSTAWALASLRIPPSLPSTVVNATENELQKVGEAIDKIESSSTSSTSTTITIPISNDIITKKVTEVEQNKLWQPAHASISTGNVHQTTEAERFPAISNAPIKSSADIVSSESIKDNTVDVKVKPKEVKPLWIPAAIDTETTSAKNWIQKEIPPIDATRSTGFESITKLPADVTTPQDETAASSELNQTIAVEKPITTTDYEITTIRFSYVPTETTEESTETDSQTTTQIIWNTVVPTKTKLTTIDDKPITTYRPKFMTTTDFSTEEQTTIVPDTTPVLEVSSQVVINASEKIPETTERPETFEEPTTTEETTVMTTESTTIITTKPSVTTTKATTTTIITTPSPTTEAIEDTTTVVYTVVTEINTEKETLIPLYPTTEIPTTTEEEETSTSEENSDSNEIIHESKTTSEPTTVQNTPEPTTIIATVEEEVTTHVATEKEVTNTPSERIVETTSMEGATSRETSTTEEGYTSYGAEMTTETSSRVLPEEAGSGAAIAIAVSTIGVIALVLLIGLLLVVRRRGRRGVYAQRCTPVSLDAYSLDSVSVGHRKGNQRLRASKRSYGNPAYDDEVTSHPMQYPALANFALDVDSMTAEFHEIPTVTVRPEEVPPGCEDKNRYSNVLPLPETRVPLKRIGNDPASEYINANYVTGPGNIKNYYILCQAPLSNTVSDFWRMIWEQNSRVVVMLTEYMENGVEKCYEYLPPSEISDNKRIFGDFKVILKKREQRDKYAISSVQLINMATRSWREVTHLWYFWPAKGVPEDYDSMIDFLFEMRSYMKVCQTAKEYDEEGVEVIYGDQNRSSFNNLSKLKSDETGSTNGVNVYSPAKAEEQMRRNTNNGTLSRMKAASEIEGIRPCVVVCASGAGRSGALAALDVCARALAAGAADVPRAVRRLRTQRPHSLSNRHHYIFLYKVLSEYGNKIMGGGDTI